MEIKGKVHCFFEQSGTFKNEFIKLGIPAEDYDIQNDYCETDNVIDLFAEIDKAYAGKDSLFDSVSKDDLILAFYPCVHFCGLSQMAFSLNYKNFSTWKTRKKFEYILTKSKMRTEFFDRLNKFVCICLERNIKMIFENPWQGQQFLRVFLKQPDVIDNNRMLRGDYMIKPTAYWFWNCTPTSGFSYQNDKKRLEPMKLKQGIAAGVCSKDRSLISSDYARNFICDFILGKEQNENQFQLF